MSSIEEYEKPKEKEIVNEPIFGPDAPDDGRKTTEDILATIYEDPNIFENKSKTLTKEDEEWLLRVKCAQDWFLRCSPINKSLFMEVLCTSIKNSYVINEIFKCILPILTKDVLEALSINSGYENVDSNNSLTINDLKEAMNSDYYWFITLEPTYQARVIIRLLRLGGTGLIFRVYQLLLILLKEQQSNLKFLSSLPSIKLFSHKDFEEISKTEAQKGSLSLSGDSKNSEFLNYTQAKVTQLIRREAELLKYEKIKGVSLSENRMIIKSVLKEGLDFLQILPIWLNRKILSYIDDKSLIELKKVGKYWGKMIDDLINEKSTRKAINAKINKIVGVKPEKEKKSKDENEKIEIINELGVKSLMNKKNVYQQNILNESEYFEKILSKKFKLLMLDHSNQPNRCCAFDKVIGTLAGLASNNSIHFYSVRSGARLSNIVFGFDSPITCIALHEDKLHIFIGCQDGFLTCSNMKTNKTKTSFNGFKKAIIAIYPTTNNVVSVSADNTLKLFQLWSGICLLCVDLNFEFITSSAAFDSNNFWAAIGTTEGVLVLIDLNSKNFLSKIRLHVNEITQICFDEDLLITADEEGKVRIWDLNVLHRNKKIIEPYLNINVESGVKSLMLYKNQIFVGCQNGILKVISLATGKVFKTIKISSQTPILGSAITEEKLGMKLIIWHEGGIEMRTFSLVTLFHNKKSMTKDSRENKQKAPKEKNQSKIFKVTSNTTMRKTQGVIGVSSSASYRSPYLNLRRFSQKLDSSENVPRKNVQKFHSDVFTKVLNEKFAETGQEFCLETFSRYKNINPAHK